jgi:hypothetical protein
VAEILNELRVLDYNSGLMETMMKEFGVDADGHIFYETFVNLLMSTSETKQDQERGTE